MPSERIQRRIDRLLDQAEEAIDAGEWERAQQRRRLDEPRSRCRRVAGRDVAANRGRAVAGRLRAHADASSMTANRRLLLSVVAVAAAAFIACSANATPADSTAAPATRTPEVATQTSAVNADAYRALFNRVNLVTLDATTLLNQLALIVTGNDERRVDIGADARLLIGSFELQLEMLQQAEPVPPPLSEAHESLKTALARYIEATTLLLPHEEGGPDRFDFFSFQPLMQEGGHDFHAAGAALP